MIPPVPRRTGGLGRGLNALIPTGPAAPPAAPASPAAPGPPAALVPPAAAASPAPGAGARFADLPLEAIEANAAQPRRHFDEAAMDELVSSIREVGLLQPVVVRALEPVDGAARYELVMGERRWRACRQAGTGTIAAIVRHTGDDDMLRDALLENLHREQLNPLEEAAAYQQLLQDFGATHEQLAARIGRSRPQISNTIRLLQLPPAVQRRVAAGVLSAGHARAILGLTDSGAQESMATRVSAEGLSVRGVEEAVTLVQRDTPRRDADQGDQDPDAEDPSSPRPRTRPAPPARLAEVAEALSDLLDTRASVELGRRRGKVTIEFASLDDLERILAVLAPRGSPAASAGGAFEQGAQDRAELEPGGLDGHRQQ